MSQEYFRFKKGFGVGSIILFALIFLCSSAHAEWTIVDPPDVSSNWELFGVRFTPSTDVWAVGKDSSNKRGVILRFSGGSWTSVTPPGVSTDWELSEVDFPSLNEGWAVGRDSINKKGVILHLSGGSWTSVTPPSVSTDWELSSVDFPSLNEGWAVGKDLLNRKGVILHFSASSWTSVTVPNVSTDWELSSLQFLSLNQGWAVGKDLLNKKGVILHFSGGAWTSLTPPVVSTDWELSAVDFPSLNEGWAVGKDILNKKGVILHFSGGAWTSITPPDVSSEWQLSSVHFPSSIEGWAVGRDSLNKRGVILHFSGSSWTSITPPDVGPDWEISDLDFKSSDDGWAVGRDSDGTNVQGVLLRYTIPNISVVPIKINFHDVAIGAFLEKIVRVRNNGTGNLVLGDLTIPSLPFIKKDLCSGKSLEPNQTCNITFRFEPTSPGPFSSNSDIPSDDPDNDIVTVNLTGNGIEGPPTFIRLVSPQDGEGFTACSYFSPPVFQWDPGEAFKPVEIQFALENDFLTVPLKAVGKPGINELAIKSSLWKRVLLLPGATGGTIYWMAVGTKADKTKVESETFSFTVEAPSPVGNPQISNTSKAALPSLSWENNCSTTFKVWFGNAPDFTQRGTKKKTLSFTMKNPNENGGNFSITLTSKEWLAVRKIVGDATGSTLYWYVASQDILKRAAQTGVESFILTD